MLLAIWVYKAMHVGIRMLNLMPPGVMVNGELYIATFHFAVSNNFFCVYCGLYYVAKTVFLSLKYKKVSFCQNGGQKLDCFMNYTYALYTVFSLSTIIQLVVFDERTMKS